jgi:beta-glucanase (GH16 family)
MIMKRRINELEPKRVHTACRRRRWPRQVPPDHIFSISGFRLPATGHRSASRFCVLCLAFALLFVVWPCRADRNLNRPGYTLNWHDEFEGPALSNSKWNVVVGYNNANNELQYYSSSNVFVSNGMLALESDRSFNNGQTVYSSGKVTSAGKFDQLYGWFEWSGKIPAGRGLWPAYWMLSYAGWPPEIDVMETIGTSVYCTTMSLHRGPLPSGCTYPWNCGYTVNTTYCGPDFSAGYHTFAVDWEPSGATFYVDGVPRLTAGDLGNCTNNMYLIMNTAVGGDWPGPPDGTTPFPSFNLVDYVRVFKPLPGRYPLLNPSFEAGEGVHDFNDWNTYDNRNIQSDPLPANARSGNKAVQVWGRSNGQDNRTGIYQDLWAGGSEWWQASVWARNRPNDTPQGANEARLKLEFLDNAGNLLVGTTRTILTNTSPTNYSQFIISGLAPFATARARMVMEYFQTANGAGSVNFDDASFDRLQPQPNVLTNGGFESALSGWTAYGASWTNYTVVTDRTIALSGSNCFKMYGQFTGAENFSGVYQDRSCVPGGVYTAEGGAYSLADDHIASGNATWIEVTFRDAATNILSLYRSMIIDSSLPANTWVELPVTNRYDPVSLARTGSANALMAPPGSAFVRYQLVFYQPPGNPAGSIFFDQTALAQPSLSSAPSLTTVSPDGSMPFLSAAGALTFTVSSTTPLASNAVRVLLNSLNISSQLSFAGSPTNLNVSFSGIAPNTIYTAVITATNAAGSAATNVTFDTFSQTSLIIEAEDFDFSSGQFFDNPAPTSIAATNSYFGRVGTDYIDENYVSYAGQHVYRPQDQTATEVAADFLRHKYFTAQLSDPNVADYNVGWWPARAWLNYTRSVPTNNYFIYARLAGGNGTYRVQLEEVTSGRGTPHQTTQLLGFCSAQGRGWQAWDWVPLLAPSGQLAILSLGGISTLRASPSGNVNANFYLLAPAQPPLTLLASRDGTDTALSFSSKAGLTYLVLYKSSLTDADWSVLTSVKGDGTTKLVIDRTNSSRRFYRIAVL